MGPGRGCGNIFHGTVFPDCSTPSTLYTSRREWYHHLHTSHSIPSKSESDFDCPLCQENLPQAARPERHIGRHLEELALFAIPRTGEEDDDDGGDSEDDSEAKSVSDVSEGAQPDHNDHQLDDVPVYDGQVDDEHILELIRDRLTALCSQYLWKLPRDPNERGLEIAKASEHILEDTASAIPSLWNQLTPEIRLALAKGLQDMFRREEFDLPETAVEQGQAIGDDDMVSKTASEEPEDGVDDEKVQETFKQKLIELGHNPEEVEAMFTQKPFFVKVGTSDSDNPQGERTPEEADEEESRHDSLAMPTKQQEIEQVFALNPEQYNTLTTFEEDENIDFKHPQQPLNLQQALRRIREEQADAAVAREREPPPVERGKDYTKVRATVSHK